MEGSRLARVGETALSPERKCASSCDGQRNLMKEGLPRRETPRVLARAREARCMLYVGLDLSRKRLDWQALDRDGERVSIGAVPPDRDGLAQRLGDTPVLAVIESMSGARFVLDQLELAGWEV